MSVHQSISSKIDAVFEAHKDDKLEDLRALLNRMLDSYAASRKKEAQGFVLLLLVWMVAALVAFDAVAEAELSSVKLKNVKLILLLAAPAVGFVGHNMIAAFMHTALLWQAIGRLYKHLLPKVYELDLENLIAPPSFVDLARISLSANKGFVSEWWPVAIGFFVLLLPALALSHIGYLLYSESSIAGWLWIASVAVGIVFWLHAIGLAMGSVVVSEG